jgi:hypothetical protein
MIYAETKLWTLYYSEIREFYFAIINKTAKWFTIIDVSINHDRIQFMTYTVPNWDASAFKTAKECTIEQQKDFISLLFSWNNIR